MQKEFQRIEANPRLNKLTLADLLVKPMHRITRYPLLFKRLLSMQTEGTANWEAVDGLIKLIEENVQKVNEMVRKNESFFRLQEIDENMDFNNVSEVCRLESFERTLTL